MKRITKKEEIKHNLIEFYASHKEECDSEYLNATEQEKLNIYEEVNDLCLINKYFINTSVVILTANIFEKNILHLNAVKKEQNIVHCTINCHNNPQRPFNVNIFFFDIGKYHVLHMEAKQTGSYSMGGSADLVRYVLRNKYCFPSAIISYGICFGNDYHKQKLGDTIIANKLYPYFMSAKAEEKCFIVKDTNIFDIDAQLDTKISFLIGKGVLSENKNIIYGNMVTGEAVISNDVMKEIFIKAATNQPILGGEMEGYGLFKECQGFECSIPCLIIKSICDWGTYKNINDEEIVRINLKDRLQAYAAKQAYKVLSIIMQQDYRVFDFTLYEQIKQQICNLSSNGERVINECTLESILEKIHVRKHFDKKSVCKIILQVLLKEGVIENANNGIFRIKGE